MVHAELNHNPYLLETSVRFNGQPPRINSQVEKFEGQSLKDWANKVPGIFYDEMNGFDFELNFTGTKSDFDEICRAFEDAGVSKEAVRLFHKNELEDAYAKSQEIDNLLDWLKKHPNRKFSFENFCADHSDLFEGSYPYIIIRGHITESFNPQIGIENIENIAELSGTLLTNTPILFYVDNSSMQQFRMDLLRVLERSDVRQNQLFFLLHPQLNTEQTRRVICDLGISTPQIVSAPDADVILAYFRNYPITTYIRQAICEFEAIVQDISSTLDIENAESKEINASIHEEINLLDEGIARLKTVDDFFAERDNYQTPIQFVELRESLGMHIRKWKNKKTKIVGEQEAEIAAREYESELKRHMGNFMAGIRSQYQESAAKIFHDFRERYVSQGLDRGFTPEGIHPAVLSAWNCPDVEKELLCLKEISYIEQKNDLFNMFLKVSAKEERKPVRLVTCSCEQWRNRAIEILMPAAGRCIQEAMDRLVQYYNLLAEAYHHHLTELISQQTQKKENVSAQLSDDERKLQEDNDWLQEFRDQLNHIERG